MSSESPEPKGSASSSPDDLCRCGHARHTHTTSGYPACAKCPSDALWTWAHLFSSADAETVKRHDPLCAGLPESEHLYCNCPTETAEGPECPCGTGGVGDYEGPKRDCPIHGKPEALESDDSWHDASPCDGCTHFVLDHNDGACKALGCLCGHPVPRAALPRRPPYAVAYALASGELYEVALSGDAVATVEDGVLKVSHPQGVASIVQVKPLEGA